MALPYQNYILGAFLLFAMKATSQNTDQQPLSKKTNDIENVKPSQSEKKAETTWRDVFFISHDVSNGVGDNFEDNMKYQEGAIGMLERRMDKLDEKDTFKGLYRYIDDFNDRMAELLSLDRNYVTSPFNNINLTPNIGKTEIYSNKVGFEVAIPVGEDFDQIANVIFGANTALYKFVNNDINDDDLENIKKATLLNYRNSLTAKLVEKYSNNVEVESALIDLNNAVQGNEYADEKNDIVESLSAVKEAEINIANDRIFILLEKASLLSNSGTASFTLKAQEYADNAKETIEKESNKRPSVVSNIVPK